MKGTDEKDFIWASCKLIEYLLKITEGQSDAYHQILKRFAESRGLQILFEPAFRMLVSRNKIPLLDFMSPEDKKEFQGLAETYLPKGSKEKRITFIKCIIAFQYLFTESYTTKK